MAVDMCLAKMNEWNPLLWQKLFSQKKLAGKAWASWNFDTSTVYFSISHIMLVGWIVLLGYLRKRYLYGLNCNDYTNSEHCFSLILGITGVHILPAIVDMVRKGVICIIIDGHSPFNYTFVCYGCLNGGMAFFQGWSSHSTSIRFFSILSKS